MAQHHLELTGVEIALEESHRSAGHPEMGDEPPVAKIHQGLHRTAGSDPLLEGDPLGVVEVQQGDPVDAQPFHRLLDGDTHPITGEVPGPRVRVDLGGQDDVGRQSTGVSDRRSDPALGGAVLPVPVRGVDEGERTVEGSQDRGDGAVLVHGVAVQVGHAGQRTGSEADRRHGEPGPAELSRTLGLPRTSWLGAHRSAPADSGGYPSVTMAVSFAITMSSRITVDLPTPDDRRVNRHRAGFRLFSRKFRFPDRVGAVTSRTMTVVRRSMRPEAGPSSSQRPRTSTADRSAISANGLPRLNAWPAQRAIFTFSNPTTDSFADRATPSAELLSGVAVDPVLTAEDHDHPDRLTAHHRGWTDDASRTPCQNGRFGPGGRV